jgi:hypothetical protein
MDASNSQQQQMQPSQQQQHFIGQAPAISPGANFATMGSHSTNVTPMKLQISQIIPASSNCAAAAQSSQHGGPPHGIAPPLTPIGVRPHNYQNGALPNKSPGTAAMHQQLQQQHARQSPTAVFPQAFSPQINIYSR